MGVERCTRDRTGLCGREEGCVGLDGIDACTVDVEDSECVGIRATIGQSLD